LSPSPFRCRHCGSAESFVRYDFPEHRKSIRECRQCRLMVLDPMPTEEELHSVYNEGYFDNEDLTQADPSRVYGYVDYISERINKQAGYRHICEQLQQYARPARKPARLLDYGCGLGFFLDAAYDHGFEVEGIEFNEYAREYIRKRYRYPVFGPDEVDGREKYDVITMFDVIEHLHEPFDTIAQLRGMLNDNGVLLLLTMDCTSVTSRLLGKRLEDFRRIREHLYFFDRANLSAILVKHGFEVLKTESIGHNFEFKLLASRTRAALPAIGVPFEWFLKVFPFLERRSIYVNPRTKFIAYARKQGA
jgi:2-polyprenyl-3-methyl-5-hydroxy-6-metoxy-1,4-benzoquinol methylase